MKLYLCLLALGLSVPLLGGAETSGGEGTLELTITDQATQRPTPCRVHLRDAAGKPVRAPGLPFWRDHFVCDGRATLALAAGSYSYEIERGTEYLPRKGTFTVAVGEHQQRTLKLTRVANMAAEGWWSGDLHVHRPLDDIKLLMQAEDLHVAPVITWWNTQNRWTNQPPPGAVPIKFDGDRFYEQLAGEDEREGGALLFFHLAQPLPISGATREYPSPLAYAAQARRDPKAWIDIEKPFWWDVPVWLAAQQGDSIGLANNHMCRDQMYESEAWGRPRDSARLPPPRGNGYWSQEIYYHILNTGIRIPPSAGSASGVLPNPVGYNRVYVRLPRNWSYADWWAGLRAGRVFVSNGPLLRCQANGKWPGHVFRTRKAKTLELDLHLDSVDPVPALEIIVNGKVAQTLPLPANQARHRIRAKLDLKTSGWFLVRALSDHPRTFRFASTAPFYVELKDQPPFISRASVQFFRDWVRERISRISLPASRERDEVLRFHEQAVKFWLDRMLSATAE